MDNSNLFATSQKGWQALQRYSKIESAPKRSYPLQRLWSICQFLLVVKVLLFPSLTIPFAPFSSIVILIGSLIFTCQVMHEYYLKGRHYMSERSFERFKKSGEIVEITQIYLELWQQECSVAGIREGDRRASLPNLELMGVVSEIAQAQKRIKRARIRKQEAETDSIVEGLVHFMKRALQPLAAIVAEEKLEAADLEAGRQAALAYEREQTQKMQHQSFLE